MNYTDPYTGNSYYITPSRHPDVEGFGSFGDGSVARFEYLTPDSRIEVLQFRARVLREVMRSFRGIQLEEATERLASIEERMVKLKTPEFRASENARLLEHRATYAHKLTPRDYAVIEKENAIMRKELGK